MLILNAKSRYFLFVRELYKHTGRDNSLHTTTVFYFKSVVGVYIYYIYIIGGRDQWVNYVVLTEGNANIN